MVKLSRLSGLVGALTLAIAAVGTAATPSDAKSAPRLQCHARGAGHIGLHARYEERVRPKLTRKKFTAEFEAPMGGSFIVGQQITFAVDSVVVGTAAITAAAGGDVEAELELDSSPNAHKGTKQFPPNFPVVAIGSLIEAKSGGNTILGCELQ